MLSHYLAELLESMGTTLPAHYITNINLIIILLVPSLFSSDYSLPAQTESSLAHCNLGVCMETIELKVDMVALHEKRLRKCLSKVKGIEKVEVEASVQKVTITGYANRNRILKALRRVGLRADFWSAHNEILSTYATASLMFNHYSFF